MIQSNHYRTVPPRLLTRNTDDLKRGYEAATKAELTGGAREFFKGRRYCVELYDRARNTLGESQAFCIGWAIGREDRFEEAQK